MAHAMVCELHRTTAGGRRPATADDPLSAMRGILLATLLSLGGFWLPLTLAMLR